MVKIFLETSPDMLGLLNKEGKVLDCNSHFAESLGYEKYEILGKTGPVDFVSSTDRQKAILAFEKVVKNGKELNVSLELIRKNKVTFPTIWSGAALHNTEGELEGYLVTGKDLSEIQELKKKIQESQKQSKKEKMAIVGQLTSRLAHDIKNPLNVIQLSIDLLKKQGSGLSEQKVQEKLSIISKNTARISSQVDYVLDFIRERPIKKENVKLNDAINESLKNTNIPENVKIDIKNSDKTVNADFNQLVIVFTNLFINAIQAFEEKCGTISVTVSEDTEFIIIEFEDSGSGISGEVFSDIFDPLVTTKQVGTGLGLVSCKSIIEGHGGLIFARNNPTTFTIKLPKNNF